MTRRFGLLKIPNSQGSGSSSGFQSAEASPRPRPDVKTSQEVDSPFPNEAGSGSALSGDEGSEEKKPSQQDGDVQMEGSSNDI